MADCPVKNGEVDMTNLPKATGMPQSNSDYAKLAEANGFHKYNK